MSKITKAAARRCYRSQGGIVIVAALIMLTVVGAFALMLAETTRRDITTSGYSIRAAKSFYAAEAAANHKLAEFRDELTYFGSIPDGDPETMTGPDLNCSGSTGTGVYGCEHSINQNMRRAGAFISEDPSPERVILISEGDFENLSAVETKYLLRSWAFENSTENLGSELRYIFSHRRIPLFQFLAFYNIPLELHPGPDSVFEGRIHSNGDIHFASKETLTLAGNISSAQHIYHGLLHEAACADGTTEAKKKDGGYQEFPACVGGSPPRTLLEESHLAQWDGLIKDQVEKIDVPFLDEFTPAPGNSYWDVADLRMVLRLDSVGNPMVSSGLSPTGVYVMRANGTVDLARTQRLHDCDRGSVNVDGKVSSLFLEDYHIDSYGPWVDDSLDAISITATPWSGLNPNPGLVREEIVAVMNTWVDRREQHTWPLTGPTHCPATPQVDLDGDPSNGIQFKNHTTLELDVGGLLTCIDRMHDNGNPLLDGGVNIDDDSELGLILFATIDGPRSHLDQSLYAVRLRNAAVLQSEDYPSSAPKVKGLSIVSDQGMVVQGSYNAPADPSLRVPSALFSDSLSVLSNRWCTIDQGRDPRHWRKTLDSWQDENDPSVLPECDFKGHLPLSQRPAYNPSGPLEVNAALVTGKNRSNENYSNGGLHNFLFFHEDFSDKYTSPSDSTVVYRGSLVVHGEPKHTRAASSLLENFGGNYCPHGPNNGIYKPPVRDYAFNPEFLTLEGLPPGTPMIHLVSQVEFSQQFGE